jgi:uncharacterized protein
METEVILPVSLGIFIIAVLYSSAGHAGASGYIAVMSLFSLSPSFIKPAALVLNILVSALAFWHFRKGGHFSWSLFWPFVLLSIPFAFVGGYLQLQDRIFEILVGVVLILSALRFVYGFEEHDEISTPSKPASIGSGAGIGLLAGMTGTGGGIFLTPLLLIMRWSVPKKAAAVTTLFIFANSISGLAGNITSTLSLPLFSLPFMVAAIAGGAIGSWLGSFRLPGRTIKHVLSVVLLIAGLKLIFVTNS